jgi:hypothetical protein
MAQREDESERALSIQGSATTQGDIPENKIVNPKVASWTVFIFAGAVVWMKNLGRMKIFTHPKKYQLTSQLGR